MVCICVVVSAVLTDVVFKKFGNPGLSFLIFFKKFQTLAGLGEFLKTGLHCTTNNKNKIKMMIIIMIIKIIRWAMGPSAC